MAHSITDNQLKTPRPVWVWHPQVHAHYREKLCYFLIAIKPYDNTVFEPELIELLTEFGVSRVCHYELLGSFDVLLRVWLVQGLRGKFERDAQSRIRNCKNVLSFEVDTADIPWAFENSIKPTDDDITRLITADNVTKIQSYDIIDNEMLQSLKDANLIADGEELERKVHRPIKAFIAISAPPEFYGNVARSSNFLSRIKRHLQDSQSGFPCRALYSGIGFAWVLIKVVVEDFYAIGRLVSMLHREHSHEGISTSTFVVSENDWRQGEAISHLALKESKGRDREVYTVLPALYDSDLSAQEIGKFEDAVRLVRQMHQSGQISDTEANTTWRFLKAVLEDDRMAAFQSLYGTFGTTEEGLRKNLKEAAGRVLGNPEKLIELLKSDAEKSQPKTSETRFAGKAIKTLALGDVFKAWRKLFAEDDEFSPVTSEGRIEFTDVQFNAITEMRNRVMHFGEFQPLQDWRAWLDNLIVLFKLTPAYRGLIQNFLEHIHIKPK